VLLWGSYDTSKPRIRILCQAMRAAGIRLETAHSTVWERFDDKSRIRGLRACVGIAARALIGWPRMAWKLVSAPRPDVILVSYPGVVDIWMARLVGAVRRIPVAFDIFISLYDTIVCDRRMLKEGSFLARCLLAFEGAAIRTADIPFMDTAAHARRIERLFGLPEGRVGDVWVGAEAEAFPATGMSARTRRPLRVLFYGQFIPLHGIDTIVAAAALLRDADIDWILVGRGQESGRIDALLDADPLPRVRRIPWIDYRELGQRLVDADVCLGIFGTSEKAASVIPNKVFQIVAAGRPLVTRDSPAIRELFEADGPCLRLVPPGDPRALAEALLALAGELPHEGAPACHSAVLPRIGTQAIGERFARLLKRSLNDRGANA
jgi:glycosyltransferase involved in cell wall biosynthesis